MEWTGDLKSPGQTKISDRVGPLASDFLTGKNDFSRCRRKIAGNLVEQRCLTGAIGTQYAENFSLLDTETDIFCGFQSTKPLVERANFQDGHAYLPPFAAGPKASFSPNVVKIPFGINNRTIISNEV